MVKTLIESARFCSRETIEKKGDGIKAYVVGRRVLDERLRRAARSPFDENEIQKRRRGEAVEAEMPKVHHDCDSVFVSPRMSKCWQFRMEFAHLGVASVNR